MKLSGNPSLSTSPSARPLSVRKVARQLGLGMPLKNRLTLSPAGSYSNVTRSAWQAAQLKPIQSTVFGYPGSGAATCAKTYPAQPVGFVSPPAKGFGNGGGK